jgi:hypothetical protein
MAEWIRALWGALLFKTEAFTGLRNRRDAFLQGLLVILVVSLLVGLPILVTDTVKGLRPAAPADEVADARAGFERFLQGIEPYMQSMPVDQREAIRSVIQQSFQVGMEIGSQIVSLPTFLPRPVGRVLQAAGGWTSRPFGGATFPLAAATVGTWLGYGIWVMLAARLLGGRGGLAGFFGTTALFAVPHVLNVFNMAPYVGGVLGFIAFAWGAAIYVKATAVSHELSIERALLAVLLPVLVAFAIAILVALVAFGLIGIALSGQ